MPDVIAEVLDRASTPIWVFDLDERRIRWANRAGLELWAAPDLDELRARSFEDMSADTEVRLAEYRATFEAGRRLVERWTLYPRGSPRTVDCTCSGLHLEDGRLGMLVEASTPAAEARASEALRAERNADALEAILDALPLNVFVKDAEGRFRHFNARTEQTTGVPKAEALGRTDADVFAAPVAERITAEDAKVWRTRQQRASEERLERSGRTQWLYAQKRVVRVPSPEGGQEDLLVGCSLDITDRRRAEAERDAQRELIRRVLDHDPNLIFVKDPEGRYTLVNLAFCKLFGRDAEALIGARNVDVHDHAEAEGYNSVDRDVLRDLEPRWLIVPFTLPSGERRYFETIKVPLPLLDGTHHVLGIATEITERIAHEATLRQAKEAAERAAELKAQLLATMSHEIRTPLNAVVGVAALLRDTSLDEAQQELLGVLEQSASHLVHVTNDVLDYSKLDAGRMQLDLRPLVLAEVLAAVRAMLRPIADQRGLALELDIGPGLEGALLGDAPRLRQVLVNLVSNAVKFTRRGRVRIAARRAQASRPDRMGVRIAVEDTGIGIATADLPLLFDDFRQLDASSTRRVGGTGLGLSISRRLVELMGGQIDVESKRGQGSVFTVQLELEPASAAPREASREPTSPCPALRVLVAEDNAVNQMLVRRLLERRGHCVEVVEDGRAAVERVQREPFDVVLMDVQMPRMDGLEATRTIRALPTEAREVPIVALTANVLPHDRTRYLEVGMTDFLAKPLSPEDLDAVLASVAARS